MTSSVLGTSLPQGLWGGQQESALFIAHVVDDIDAAVAHVAAHSLTSPVSPTR
jgi:hypothetical protein